MTKPKYRPVGEPIQPSIICLGGGVESLEIIKQVKSLGYRPIIMSLPGVPAQEWVDSFPKASLNSHLHDSAIFWKADVYNAYSILSNIGLYARWPNRLDYDGKEFEWSNIGGILCCAVDSPHAAAVVAEKYRWHTIGADAALLGVNKYWQWMRLNRAGIPVPATRIVSPESLWDDVKDYSIVKPVDSRGARGVLRYDETNWQSRILQAAQHSKLTSAIAQQWIDGVQLSTESVVWNGEVAMTAIGKRNYARLNEYAPYVIEDGCDMPMDITADDIQKINKVIEQSCRALGWDKLTVKGDLILDNYGIVWVIELAARLSGGYFASHTIPLAYGWNIVQDATLIAMGHKPKIEFTRRENLQQYVSQRYVFPRKDMIGKRIKDRI